MRFSHFRTEEGNETDDQQSTHAALRMTSDLKLVLIQSKPQLFDLNGLGYMNVR
jgi:hypothetical protein